MLLKVLSYGLVICFLITATVAAPDDLAKKKIRAGDEINTIDIGYYGLGVSLRFDDSLKDRIVVEYPPEIDGKHFKVTFEEREDTLTILVLPEGFKPSAPDDTRGVLVNFLKLLVDFLEMEESSGPRFFRVILPVRFEDHVHTRAVL